jgi:lipoprotein signal peptidase
MSNRLLSILVPVLLMGVVADQASKSWATHHAARPRMLVPGYLAAYAVPNAGIMLGLGRDRVLTGAAVALVGVVCTLLLVRIVREDRGRSPRAAYLAVASLMAGLIGNTADRLVLGHVRDFLVTWALPTLVFNVADLLLFVGGASLLMAVYRGRRRARPDLGFAG